MAGPPLVALRDITLRFGAKPLLDGASLALARGDRVCLVGRNGSGKSTIMKIMANLAEPDTGERFVQPGVHIAWLPQEPVFDPDETVADYVSRGELGEEIPSYEVDAVLDRFDLAGARLLGTLSGGEGRRAALARALVTRPDVLLLDEPTNHLDLPTIERLEGELTSFPGAVLAVSHDRAFLTAMGNRIAWLDRGRLRETDRSFARFDEWVEAVLTEEENEAQRLDTRIAQEAHWLHRGVTARRKRNQGRLVKLQEFRAQRANLLGKPARANIVVREGEVRSKLVIEAEHVAKSFARADGTRFDIVRDFSTRIMRGDRVGLLGPNGTGKTTLLRMLTGDLAPDSGTVRVAQGLEPAYFDQRRAALNLDDSLWTTLCPAGGDTVSVHGTPRHVVSYLKDFMFAAEQVRSPVSSLSGGERNRLMLAKLLARPTNLLIMDEPTNDLDMDTLDLLEDVLGDYAGTLLVVSHDRDFLDRIVTSVIALEGDGIAREYPGGYSDYRRQRETERRQAAPPPAPKPAGGRGGASSSGGSRADSRRMSYKQVRELEQLPGRMEGLTAEIAKLEAELADPRLFSRDAERFQTVSARLAAAQQEMADAEERWLELEMEREAAAEAGR